MSVNKGTGLMTFESVSNIYTEVGIVGEGDCGRVVKVSDDEGHTYALKYLKPEKQEKRRVKRFVNELNFCANVDHPNIVKAVDSGYVMLKEKKCPFYVMQFYPETLRTLMERGLPPQNVLPLFQQVLKGLEAAHLHGVVHRDLKPENILCDESAESLAVADFGIAHFAEEALHTLVITRPNERHANFLYAAPEQHRQGQPVGYSADIFALGMILNEMFTGEPPLGVGFRTIAAVLPEFAYLDPLVEVMLATEPSARPASIDKVNLELKARGDEFVSRQKLSALRRIVVPLDELDDPLVLYPVNVTAVDFDFPQERMELTLSQSVNREWATCFRNSLVPSHLVGYGPDAFHFNGNKAVVPMDPGTSRTTVQRIVDDFTSLLRNATTKYEALLHQRATAQREQEEANLRRQIQAEERRQQLRSQIRL